ncbi:ABC transporter substrate-binding protein [Nocardia sp. NPDC052566]|uniref:ABC transporter substrate-binding protein n=1 Tax=Nocardia sp. NPDC052566 TaxID=3364330 RepID=UPI0037CA21C5
MPVSALVRTRFRTSPARTSAVPRRTSATRRRGALVVALSALVLVAGCSQKDHASSIVRTTTNIAGAGVIGLERDTAKACALPTAPDPSNGATRTVHHVAGSSDVPADPQRIVVLTTAALDAACSLGLWERVVGATTLTGPSPQPSYLGYGIAVIPSVGPAAQPDLAKIAELRPDVIIGDVPTATAGFDALRAIAPTVFVGRPGNWQNEFSAIGAALGRRTAASEALERYRTDARDIGNAVLAGQTQASVIRFTGDGIQVQGGDSFAGQVLADMGVQRPTAQRGPTFDVTTAAMPSKVEGDLIYIMFAGEPGKQYGEKVMRGDTWKELGAATDRRTFVVEDTIWRGNGLTAARAVLTDVRDTLNGFVTD